MTTTPRVAPKGERPHDLVLFGATGFTGKLVAEYLAESRPPGLRWALAGRSRDKLGAVRDDLGRIDARLRELPILIADTADPSSLQALAAATRVVLTTVGPYGKYGRGLVAACADSGTDYCDLTGEVPFIRDSIDRNHDRARATGARIVHCCGFDSLPSDLGVYLLGEHFAASGRRLGSARFYVEAMRGGVSGGTIASMLNIMAEAKQDPAIRRLILDPYSLYPDPRQDRGPELRDPMSVGWDGNAGCITAPFVMGGINTRIVRRSNALRDFPFGRDFRYDEVMSFPPGPLGVLKAAGVTAATASGFVLGGIDATRQMLEKLLPASGEGPSQAERERGFFRVAIRGQSAPDATGYSRWAIARVEGLRDPGYGETARMIGESALCLAFDELPTEGGVLTPAVAMGSKLIERLRRVGMTWQVGPA